jgi:hypothetical protein
MPRKFDQLVADPIFVVGAARSGTTWVHDILAKHPQVAHIHESWLFTEQDGIGSLFNRGHWPSQGSGLGRLLERDDLLTYTGDMVRQIMSHAIGPEHRFLVEKSPSHLYSMELIREIFKDARFIHVLRDGRDVAVSVRAAVKSWSPAWKETFGSTVMKSARAWKYAVKRAHRENKMIPDRFLEIRYESLRKDPWTNYRRIFEFCNIPITDEILKTVLEKTDFQKNYIQNEAGFRRGGRIGDWRTHLNVINAFSFDLMAGKVLRDLGYEKNRLWWLTFVLRRRSHQSIE